MRKLQIHIDGFESPPPIAQQIQRLYISKLYRAWEKCLPQPHGTETVGGSPISRMLIKILALVIVCLLIEVSLRLILGLGSPVLYEPDAAFGYFPKANQHLHRFFVDIDTDEHGMRSAPFSEKKGPKEFRIFFVGDSVPFGTTYVGQKEIFVEDIAARLHDRNASITVLNGSAPGWAPDNELLFLKARGTYDADMVVMVYNTKDLTQPFAAYQESPLFPRKNPSTALGELWSRYLKPRIFSNGALVDPGSTGSDGLPAASKERSVLDTIEATRQLVTSKGARFMILFSPAVTPDVRRHQSDWDQALLALKTWAADRQVPVVDLTVALTAAHEASKVFFDGIHLRPAGDEVVADAFLSWFASQQTK